MKNTNFDEIFEIRDGCKGAHCVDLGESFPTSIYLQNLASIQPRTSRLKLGGIRCLRIVIGIMFAIKTRERLLVVTQLVKKTLIHCSYSS